MRDIVHRRCCGLDVHKDQIAACIRWVEDNGEIEQETRVFGTTTEQLRSMGDWMRGHGVQLVAMESTGVYWRPVWNVLEGDFQLKLANSQHIRNIPGKKTDKKDGAWIAKLLQHDLVPASFVPDTRIQELRELTRTRARLVQERTAVANRIHDVLENANIKLASVASDILGRSGRAMLEAIVGGESDPSRLADLAKARLRSKIQRLRLALEGRIREHHRFSLRQLMDHLEFLEGKIFIIEEELRRRSQPYEEAIQFWMTIRKRPADAVLTD
jgi:transposase